MDPRTFLRRLIVIAFVAASLPGSDCWRFDSRRQEPQGWTRESHLRLSTGCSTECNWPTHAGSFLFRLFRGRRSPTMPRLGMDLMLPWLHSAMNEGSGSSSQWRLTQPGRPSSVAAVFAIRRGPRKPLSRLSASRLATLPPRVTVQVYGLDNILYTIGVPLRPQTSLFEILNQASARYRDQKTKGALNPFNILVQMRKSDGNCVEIQGVGPWLKSTDAVWDITLTDSLGKVTASDTCLISTDTNQWQVYPGNTVTLRYRLN